MKNIEDLRPPHLSLKDQREIKKDIYYSSFKKGLGLTCIVSAFFLLLFVFTHLYKWVFVVELRDVAVIFSAGIVAVTCLYHAQNLRLNIEVNEIKLAFDYEKFVFEQTQKRDDGIAKKEFEKKFNSFEICRRLVSSEMTIHLQKSRLFYLTDPLIQELQQISPHNNQALKEWSKKFNLHSARKSVILVLNYFEQVAIAINEGFADEEVSKNSLKTIMQQYFIAYRSFIDYRQNDVEEGSATFMENFEKLAIKWSGGDLRRR
ncbi:DUF4760 domain-containing protein [Flavitalea flava]